MIYPLVMVSGLIRTAIRRELDFARCKNWRAASQILFEKMFEPAR
jgi:hypothetical protein